MQIDFSQPILAIDTSTPFLSLALSIDGKPFCHHQEAGHQQAELILPNIRQLFEQANIQTADLAAIVYAQGAGAFTGLRIGIGIAQGLATPFNIPLIGVPCLDAVASCVPNQSCVLAATDARMGEVFYAFFDTQNHRRLSDYQVGAVQDIVVPEGMKASEVYGVGNAFALDNPPPYSGSLNMPTAWDYLLLAQSGRYTATAAAQAELLYVRNKIALTAAEQAKRKFQAA